MTAPPAACDRCLARAWTVAGLSERIESALGTGPGGRARELLALGDADLAGALGVEAVPAPDDRAATSRRRAALQAARCWACCPHGSGYPGELRDLGDPPAAIFGLGDAALLTGGCEGRVTLVGARRASAYGLDIAARLARELSAAGATLVSGMAIGVDSRAHRGALGAGGPTIAVLGSGPDVPTPPRMRSLHAEIAERGAVVSELPPGTPARRWTFPARNRIMAALAAITVVAEARARSGSLITAAMASDLGREVGAVPGRVTERCAAGSNGLLRDGAQVIRDARDVLDSLLPLAGRAAGDPANGSDGRDRAAERDPREAALLELLEGGEAGLDSLARASELEPAELAAGLARLELAGRVAVDDAGRYRLT